MDSYPPGLLPLLDKIDPTFGQNIDCGEGWWPLLEQMHSRIIEIDPDYRIYQIKEKFGSLRFYFASSEPSRENAIRKIVLTYERLSILTCEKTGKPGEIMTKGGVYKTLHRSFTSDGWVPVSQEGQQ